MEAGIEVLLITSRRRGRWIVPKGWPINGLSLSEAAAREAEEEAGVEGHLGADPIGEYRYVKQTKQGYDVRCHVFVYPLLVLHHRVDWRERAERDMRWFSLEDAARNVDDRGLGKLLTRLAESGGTPLQDIVRRMSETIAGPAAARAE